MSLSIILKWNLPNWILRISRILGLSGDGVNQKYHTSVWLIVEGIQSVQR